MLLIKDPQRRSDVEKNKGTIEMKEEGAEDKKEPIE